jgi:hypothetical protein
MGIEGNGDHRLVRFRSYSEKKQVWILISTATGECLSTHKDKIKKMTEQEMLDNVRRQEEKRLMKQKHSQEVRANMIYKNALESHKHHLIERGFDTNSVFACLDPRSMLYNFYEDNVNSIYLQNIDSVRYRKTKSNSTVERTFINQRVFQQELKPTYDFLEDNKNIDSVVAVRIATAAAAKCYGSEMTPFMARLMGDNKEHWMVYCFPTIPDNIEKQTICYVLQLRDYERGMRFNTGCGSYLSNCRGCPVVFVVLISRENGHVLTIDKP